MSVQNVTIIGFIVMKNIEDKKCSPIAVCPNGWTLLGVYDGFAYSFPTAYRGEGKGNGNKTVRDFRKNRSS